ncbi:MAG: putative glycoside hydrolase [Elusimicrobia bacterium]|nr:putative glycoside hydrolase [Elusimicrobiota bacterium]
MAYTLFFLLLAQPGPVSAQAARSAEALSIPASQQSTSAITGDKQPANPVSISTETIRQKVLSEKIVRGIHLTCWSAGSAKSRREIIGRIKKSVINTVVVAVKETDGKVYIPGVKKAEAFGSYEAAIPDPEEMVGDFKAAKLYTVARIVTFKDNIAPKKRKDLAVRTPEGDLWRSHNGATWMDPYNREVWDYNLEVAARAAKAGFNEIQFDYVRYPSEGNTARCRYSKHHSSKTATANLADFLKYARKKLEPYSVKISADVFGLTTSVKDDMGIGQDLRALAENADYIYPMMYPSHYYPGEYGLKNPNSQPYKVINHGLKDAYSKLGLNYSKIRPYLQDFSHGKPHYGPEEVRAQMMALRRNMLESWILWNPGNKYTWNALTPQYYRAFVDPHYESVTAK